MGMWATWLRVEGSASPDKARGVVGTEQLEGGAYSKRLGGLIASWGVAAVVEVQVGLVSGKAGRTAPRGGARRAGGGHAEVAEDAVDDGAILDGGEERHATVAGGAAQDVDAERALHQRCPSEPAITSGVIGIVGVMSERGSQEAGRIDSSAWRWRRRGAQRGKTAVAQGIGGGVGVAAAIRRRGGGRSHRGPIHQAAGRRWGARVPPSITRMARSPCAPVGTRISRSCCHVAGVLVVGNEVCDCSEIEWRLSPSITDVPTKL